MFCWRQLRKPVLVHVYFVTAFTTNLIPIITIMVGAKREIKAGIWDIKAPILPNWLSKIMITKRSKMEFVAAVDNAFPIFVWGSFFTKKETILLSGSN